MKKSIIGKTLSIIMVVTLTIEIGITVGFYMISKMKPINNFQIEVVNN